MPGNNAPAQEPPAEEAPPAEEEPPIEEQPPIEEEPVEEVPAPAAVSCEKQVVDQLNGNTAMYEGANSIYKYAYG